jgi:ketosteroid isomerase-like protein
MCLLLALGCAPAPAPPEPEPVIDLEAERASLLATDRAWFEAYSTSETPEDVFADNVVDHASLLPPGAPMSKGRESIREAIAELEAMDGFSVTWTASAAQVVGNAKMGYTIGTYEMKMAPEGSPITINGKYLTVWEKQADGSWMVSADMFNANGPPEPSGD